MSDDKDREARGIGREKKSYLAAVIAAAGLSSRMKDFKPLMKIGGITLIERIVRTFRTAGVEEILVVTGRRATELNAVLQPCGVRCLYNPAYETGDMFSSVRIGLSAVPAFCDRVFFCPGDVPLFSEATLKGEIRTQASVVIPAYQGRDGHPILLSSSVVPEVLASRSDCGLRGAISSLTEGSVTRLPVEDEGIVLDADTPEDFVVLLELYQRKYAHGNVGEGLIW